MALDKIVDGGNHNRNENPAAWSRIQQPSHLLPKQTTEVFYASRRRSSLAKETSMVKSK